MGTGILPADAGFIAVLKPECVAPMTVMILAAPEPAVAKPKSFTARVLRRYEVTPEDFGMKRAPLEEIRGGRAAENAELIRRIFEGRQGASRDIVAVNAGAALVVTGVARTLREGAEFAEEAIRCGAAKKKLEEMVKYVSK